MRTAENKAPPPPGARVLIRDEEWLVRNATVSDVGGYQLECLGVSETVRHREALFLTLIDDVQILDPRNTDLVCDDSPQYITSRLYLEARLRQTVPTGPEIVLGHRAAFDSLPFQLQPTHQVLGQIRPRFLIADAVGLGKTLEAGILISELMRRGKGRRILVVTTKAMLGQFQKELWTRFSIPLVRLDAAGIQRLRRQLPVNHNPFTYYDRTIVSVDTLKKDSEYRHHLENAFWDIIVIDEAHNVSFKGGNAARTKRARLASLLSQRSEALILLTATPHNGRPESFASLIRMLDPTALPARKTDYTRDDVAPFFVRRFKADVAHQIRQRFPERQVFHFRAAASAAEERAFSVLAGLDLHIDQDRRGSDMLFRTTLEKALLSSPAACAETVRERMKRLTRRQSDHPDLPALDSLRRAVEAIAPDEVSKLQELVNRLKSDPVWRWDPSVPSDRLVLFTERIETLEFLKAHLPAKLGLKQEAVAILHGQLPDSEIRQTVESFGRTHSPLRLLIASDVASEGINLHFQSHRLVHFDIPWSLMVFQQRNGRVDRYGQAHKPLIAYLSNEVQEARIAGDMRILEILTRKDEQAAQNIGDPSIFMNLYDETAETLAVAQAIESRQSAQDFEASLEAPSGGMDFLDALMGKAAHTPPPEAKTRDPISLFASDFEYLRQALTRLNEAGALAGPPQVDPATQSIAVQPGADLHRFLSQQLTTDMIAEDRLHVLCADRAQVQKAIADARDGEDWPTVQLLWPNHPILQWGDYRMLALLRRHTAPVIRVPRGISKGEALILITAVIPNRRGQPILNEWLAVRVDAAGNVPGVLTLEELMRATGFGREPLPNANESFDAKELQRRLAPALDKAAKHMADAQKKHRQDLQPRIESELVRLKALRSEHIQKLEEAYGDDNPAAALHRDRKRLETQETEKLFQSYQSWVLQTLELDERAQLTVVAVFVG